MRKRGRGRMEGDKKTEGKVVQGLRFNRKSYNVTLLNEISILSDNYIIFL